MVFNFDFDTIIRIALCGIAIIAVTIIVEILRDLRQDDD